MLEKLEILEQQTGKLLKKWADAQKVNKRLEEHVALLKDQISREKEKSSSLSLEISKIREDRSKEIDNVQILEKKVENILKDLEGSEVNAESDDQPEPAERTISGIDDVESDFRSEEPEQKAEAGQETEKESGEDAEKKSEEESEIEEDIDGESEEEAGQDMEEGTAPNELSLFDDDLGDDDIDDEDDLI